MPLGLKMVETLVLVAGVPAELLAASRRRGFVERFGAFR